MSSVRVAAPNLWGRHGAWDERRSVLVDGPRELQPDIIAFQEAVVTEGYDQVADLLGAGYQVVRHAGRDAGGTGHAWSVQPGVVGRPAFTSHRGVPA